jgi:hypothetical protein
MDSFHPSSSFVNGSARGINCTYRVVVVVSDETTSSPRARRPMLALSTTEDDTGESFLFPIRPALRIDPYTPLALEVSPISGRILVRCRALVAVLDVPEPAPSWFPGPTVATSSVVWQGPRARRRRQRGRGSVAGGGGGGGGEDDDGPASSQGAGAPEQQDVDQEDQQQQQEQDEKQQEEEDEPDRERAVVDAKWHPLCTDHAVVLTLGGVVLLDLTTRRLSGGGGGRSSSLNSAIVRQLIPRPMSIGADPAALALPGHRAGLYAHC